MEINNNKLNSLPQQVEENMENIKLLAQYIKEAYKTSLQLTNASVSIAITDTNAPDDTTSGWLLDSRGLLFNITGGDGTNLLLDFYTDLKGIQGINGVDGTNGTDGTNIILVSGTTLIIGYTATIPQTSFNITPKVNDIVLDESSNLGKVIAINGTNADVLGLYSIKGDTGANGTDGTTSGLVAFTNINVDDSDFVTSTDYTNYGYECIILQSNILINANVTGGMVVFDVNEADSGDYSSVCNVDTTTGEVKIYSKVIPSGDFTIPCLWLIVQ